MPWVRIDDAFYDHCKTMKAGPAAELLWYRALQWTNRNRKDGFVPMEQMRRLADFCFDLGELLTGPGQDPDRPEANTISWVELADRLVAAGLWTTEEDGSGYRFHDYHDYQFSADAIGEQRSLLSQKRAEAGRKGAAKRWQDGKQHGNGMANPQQDDDKTMAPIPIPIPRDLHPPTTDSRLAAVNGGVVEEAIRIIMKADRAEAGAIKNPAAWERTVTERLTLEHGDRIAKLHHEYPTATAVDIAGYLRDGTNALRYHERRTDA